MSENPMVDVMKEVATSQVKEIYQDGLKGVTQESGQALQTIVGIFNNVVLYPFKKTNITFKYKLEQFESDLREKVKDIPKEKIIEPPINVVGPAIESLKYTFDTKELREMYMNLLTSSMNIDKIQFAHPSYVEIIKQLTPLDALVLKKINDYGDKVRCSRITFSFANKVFTYAMPRLFAPDLLCIDCSPFLISASIENLCRLGIVINYNAKISGADYSFAQNHQYVKERFEIFKDNSITQEYYIKFTEEALDISDFGENFIRACINEN